MNCAGAKNRARLLICYYPQHVTTSVLFYQTSTLSEQCRVTTLKLHSSLPNKSCDLGPILATCLRQYVAQLTPVTTEIIHLSLNCGEFREFLKHALVRPLLTKPNLLSDLLASVKIFTHV